MSSFNTKGVRNFLSSRLKSFAGYLCPPAISDAMLFLLPPFRVVSARLVRIEGSFWELWSPNSQKIAFYPGLRDPNLRPEDSLPLNLRRCDGHVGRFDPTVSPQHFDPERMWLGFIRREGGEAHPEYTPVINVWTPLTRPNRGYLSSTYVTLLKQRVESVVKRTDGWRAPLVNIKPELWEGRPAYPSTADLTELDGNMSFDQAVDSLAKLQRSIKHLCAWCRLAHAIVKDAQSPVDPISAVPLADDSLMGVWLNGCEEGDGMLLLRWRVPSFIIHSITVSSEMDRVGRIYNPHHPNFVAGTPAAKLTAETYAIDLAVLMDKGDLRDVTEDYAICPPRDIIPHMRTDRLRASPMTQGFRDETYSDPRDAARSQPLPQTLNEENGKLIPPPVASVTQGRWSSWKEDDDNLGARCMVAVGRQAARSLGGKVYYDRSNRRRLHFSEHPFVPPNYDADPGVYGLPGPDLRYMERGNNNQEFPRSSSKWIYRKEKPDRGTEGTIYAPSPSEDYAPKAGRERQIPDSESSDSEEQMDLRSRSSASPLLDIQPQVRSPRSPLLDSDRMVTDPALRDNRLSPLPSYVPGRSDTPPSVYAPASVVQSLQFRDRGRSRDLRDRPESSSRRRSRSWSPELNHRSRRPYRHSERHWSPAPNRPSRWAQRSPPPARSRRRSPSEPRSSRRSRSRSPRRMSRSSGIPRRYSPPRTPILPIRSPSPSKIISQEPSPWPTPFPPSSAEPPPPEENDSMDNAAQEDDRMDVTEGNLMNVARRPIVEREALEALLPPMTAPSFPVLTSLDARVLTKFLCIWSFAVFYVWDDVISWIEALVKTSGIQITRVVRTNEDGKQVFWFKMGTERDAAHLRGLIDRAKTEDAADIRCDFIDSITYNNVCGKSTDAWSPRSGLELEQKSSAPFSSNPCLLPKAKLVDRLSSATAPDPSPASLADRLTSPATLQ